MAPEWWTSLAVFIVAIAAERLHARRTQALSLLIVGRAKRFSLFAKIAPLLTAIALAAVAWACTVLLATPPQRWAGDLPVERAAEPTDLKRLIVLLDVSPSMDLPDAGGNKQTRGQRAAAVLDNLITRIDPEQTRISIVPFYTGARPVVVDAVDPALVHYLATEATLTRAFSDGVTDLNASINTALDLAKPWRNNSTTLLVLTDGDSVSPTPIDTVPPAINRAMVIGVGDTISGTFVEDHISRQDPENLGDVAAKLRGRYFNADQKFVPTTELESVGGTLARSTIPPAGRRDVALRVLAAAAFVLAMLPALLAAFGMTTRVEKPASVRPNLNGAAS